MNIRELFGRLWRLFQNKPLECFTLLTAFVSLGWNIATTATTLASNEIREVIELEAKAARNKNTTAAVSLFVQDVSTAVYDVVQQKGWIGIGEISNRYMSNPPFESLMHTDVHVDPIQLISGAANATSVTFGKMSNGQLLYSRDVWEFKKINGISFLPWTGEWRIKNVRFNTPIN